MLWISTCPIAPFAPEGQKGIVVAGVRTSFRPSVNPSVRLYDQACPRDHWGNISKIFLKNAGIVLAKYLGQVWSLVSQLISYAHNWQKRDVDIFAFLNYIWS